MEHITTTSESVCIIALDKQELFFVRTARKVIISFLTCLLGHRTGAKNLVAVVLFILKFPVCLVEDLSGVGRSSAYKLQAQVRAGLRVEDLDRIVCYSWKRGRPAKLTQEQKQDVYDSIENKNYFTLRQVADYINDAHEVPMSPSAVGKLLKEGGIKKYRCGSLPAKADPEEQRMFYETTLVDLIRRSKEQLAKVYFMDAAHFVIGTDFIAAIYGRTRRFCKTFSGRKRYNVLGAIEFASKDIITVTNETYITATEVAEMLKKLKDASDGLPVYVVLDNARYQKCKLVTDTARELNINLVYLPSYSPNLNLIERLWKYTKSELRQHYYDDFEEFKKRIDQILDEAQTTKRYKLESLISENFQFFDGYKNIDGNTYAMPTKKSG